jgi:secreted trypsin-like serine protease
MICGGILASYSNGKDGESPCYGDSGGPILTKTGKDFYIVGIVSWGIECYSNLTPQVFTNVYYHNDWIKDKLENS